MIRVRLQIDSALSRLQGLARRFDVPQELLEPALPVVARAIERNFEEEGRPLPWTPLAASTLRHKPPGLKILELTGRLRRSIFTRVEGAAIVLSTDVPYAAALQFGVPRRGLPARPFLVLTNDDLEQAAHTLADSLTES